MEKKLMFCIPKGGFTVRESLEFVNFNSSFECEVSVVKNNRTINAKSILGTLSLLSTSKSGEELMIHLDGEDAEYASQQIARFIEKKITNANSKLDFSEPAESWM
ncbi:HPr family phosphocarrier protein [Salipaludibacillus sp. CUR1]|uniref:HPr family phosphocarrier protein n=1 Tax=Salipaludibacillus sp. CUR1 TaxID=2820003 RepID=UPI001E552D46|nr:HPr family phosphocarrier protein [Salipaludibacillus sp. CUR1]MCE7792054.1 HPr family phosphocarrier protein [Salipaludibacillus sp. CUR1]